MKHTILPVLLLLGATQATDGGDGTWIPNKNCFGNVLPKGDFFTVDKVYGKEKDQCL